MQSIIMFKQILEEASICLFVVCKCEAANQVSLEKEPQ